MPVRRNRVKTKPTAPETLALLKILALGRRQVEEGKVVAAADVFRALRNRMRRRR